MSHVVTLRLTQAQAEALCRTIKRSIVDLTVYYDELSCARRLSDVKRLEAICNKLVKAAG